MNIAVLADFGEEGWPSMDLCAEMLVAGSGASCTFSKRCPPFRRRFTALPGLRRRRAAFNADRLVNRFLYYPWYAKRLTGEFDAYHVVDHSYAQLVHVLSAERTGVYCHDTDAFRSLVDPNGERRPWWYRRVAKRQLAGLRRAALVFHSTMAVREAILHFGLIESDRLVHAPYGVSPEFTACSKSACPEWLRQLEGAPFVAHVGNCIPRKRIDVLLDVVAATRAAEPRLKLVKIGGDWTADQRDQIERLSLSSWIVHRHDLTREELAHVYRNASAVLVTSDTEGFGLPVIEALACGAVVLASDIPVLRETGGDAALYAPRADVQMWSELLVAVVAGRAHVPDRQERLQWASRFSWPQHVATIEEGYRRIVGR